MRYCAKLDINSYEYVGSGLWRIVARLIDNTGTIIASNVEPDNIIYIEDVIHDEILRYKIVDIDHRTLNSMLVADIQWDSINDPIEPIVGANAIIGSASNNLKFITLINLKENLIEDNFVDLIKNYENFMLIDSKFEPKQETNIIKYIAGENIDAFKVVYLKDDKVYIADSSNLESSDNIIGLSIGQYWANEEASIKISGTLINPDWNFEGINKTLFIGHDGNMTIIPEEDAKYVQQIGLLINENQIDIDIEESIDKEE